MNRLIFALICLIGISATSSYAQPARKDPIGIFRYLGRHSSFFYDVYVTADSNYVATGRTEAGANPEPFWVVLSNREGEEIWSAIFPQDRGGYDEGDATSIIETDDGDFAVGGQMEFGGELRYVVFKCNAEGEQIWFNTYGGGIGLCLAVIETKAGNLLTCGTVGERGQEQAYAAMLTQDGDVIWDNIYANGVSFMATREVGDGYLFADYGPGTGLFKVNEEGELLWQHQVDGTLLSLVSCPVDGGFAACGSRDRTALLVRFNDEGRETWSRVYEIPEGRYSGVANCLVQMPEGGFYMVGERPLIWSRYRTRSQFEIEVDSDGRELWQRARNSALVMGYLSVVRDIDGLNVIAGSVDMEQQPAGSDFVGILEKVYPQSSAPIITGYTPEELHFEVMRLDTVQFGVEAIDYQDDEIIFQWLFDDSVTIGRADSVEVFFTELWDHTVSCVLSDGELETRLDWTIYVKELVIDGHIPESLDTATRRNTPTFFSVSVDAAEPDIVEYLWTIADSTVGSEPEINLEFSLPMHYFLTASATANEYTDRIRWDIEVQSVFSQWQPVQTALSIDQYSTQQFCLTPSNPESDSLQFSWKVQDAVISDSAAVEVNFPDPGFINVTGILSDGAEIDSIRWEISVIPNNVPGDADNYPMVCALSEAFPNPFNSTTTIEYSLPELSAINLSLYNLHGQKIRTLVSNSQSAGVHQFTLDGVSLPAGLYFVRLETTGKTFTRKIMLVK